MTQKHHIVYKNEHQSDWVVELTGWQHKAVTHMQRMKGNRTNELKARKFVHAVIHEWNRIAYQVAQIESKDMNAKKTARGKR